MSWCLGSLISLNKFFCDQIMTVVQTVYSQIDSVLHCMKKVMHYNCARKLTMLMLDRGYM